MNDKDKKGAQLAALLLFIAFALGYIASWAVEHVRFIVE